MEAACNQWNATQLIADMATFNRTINEIRYAVAPQEIYPHYSRAVHGTVCSEAIKSVSWLLLLKAMLILFCLPFLEMTADCFLTARARQTQAGDESDEEAGTASSDG